MSAFPVPPKKSYTVTEAARRLGISRAAVALAIKKGRLEAVWGKVVTTAEGWVISPDALQKYRVSLSHQVRGKKS